MKILIKHHLLASLLVFAFTRPIHAQLPNAWQITDSSSSGPSGGFYSTNLTGPWPAAALSDGWRYSINARMVDDSNGSITMVFLYGVGTDRFSIFWDLDGDDNLTARRPYIKQLLREMIPRRRWWLTQASMDIAHDRELLDLMEASELDPENLNGFTLLRFLAASVVLVSHSWRVTGRGSSAGYPWT